MRSGLRNRAPGGLSDPTGSRTKLSPVAADQVRIARDMIAGTARHAASPVLGLSVAGSGAGCAQESGGCVSSAPSLVSELAEGNAPW